MKKIVLIIGLLFAVSSQKATAATTYDFGTDTSAYSIRIDGPDGTSALNSGTYVTDLDGDGLKDLLIGSNTTDFNSRTDSGSIYVIYGSLLRTYSLGSTIDLSDPSKWNIRIDGALAGHLLGSRDAMYSTDLDNDGKQDLLVGARVAGYNSRIQSGSLWILPYSILHTYTGTGNTIDLSDTSKYWIRYDGPSSSVQLSDGAVRAGDLDNDGKQDLLVGARGGNGSLYVFMNTLLNTYAGTGNNVDLATATNYSILYGTGISSQLTKDCLFVTDIDNDGKMDIIVGAQAIALNGKTGSGAVYLIYNTLIDDYSGTGNSVNLATTSNFNVRYEGGYSSESIGIGMDAVDLDRDGKKDLVFGAFGDQHSRTDSGSLYVIYNTLIDDYTGTGNTVDIGTSSTYNMRFDGAVAGENLGSGPGIRRVSGDYDFNGKADLLMGAMTAGLNGKTTSGVFYIVTDSKLDALGQSTGNTFDMANDANYDYAYIGASSGDQLGAFGDQGFSDLNGDGTDDLIFIALGTDYNSRPNSGSVYIIYRQSPPGPNPPLPPVFLSVINHPKPDLLSGAAGVVGNEMATSIVSNGTFRWDSYLSTSRTKQMGAFHLPGTIYWQVSSRYEVWWKAFANDAKILPSEVKLPFILAFPYRSAEIEQGLSEKKLRLAYSPDNKNWKVLFNSVVDIKNKTVSTVTKNGGWYMLVSSPMF